MESLSKLCEICLMRNYQQLQDVTNVPYRLIKNILYKVKVDQLHKLEKSNVLLVFEDDELWLNFLKQDFPTSIHDSFVSKKDMIKQYYFRFVEENNPTLLVQDCELYEAYVQKVLKKDLSSGRYKVPYRMLYFKYQEDVTRKQEKSAERLRLQMKQLQQERMKKQTVVVDHSFCAKNQPRKSKSLPKEHHSELFRKSIKEHGTRLRHFKSGGFDIAKRHASRVAFGGSAGGVSSGHLPKEITEAEVKPTVARSGSVIQDDEPKPIQHVATKPPSSKKRRIDPPSIFLSRKRPVSKFSNPTEDVSTNKVPTVEGAASGHKKKSALFSTSSQHLSTQEGDRKPTQNVYIFDRNDSLRHSNR